jgi:hypothetical protein
VHPDPERLFEQADALINEYKSETDLRRAISTAYYGVFHFILRNVADTGNRSTNLYSMVYRSIEHKPLRDLCITLGSKKKSYAPIGGFGPVVEFAKLVRGAGAL